LLADPPHDFVIMKGWTQTVLSQDSEGENKPFVCSIQAPTGSGKTTSTLECIATHPRRFGSTLFIEPTRIACQKLVQRTTSNGLRLLNVQVVSCQQALKIVLKHKTVSYDCVVMDEIHAMSREQVLLLHLFKYFLGHPSCPFRRLVFLSATIPLTFLKLFFPGMRHEEFPGDGPYPVSVVYEPQRVSGSRHVLFTRCLFRVKEAVEQKRQKILLFFPTHKECEMMQSKLRNLDSPVLVFHGGLDYEEKQEVMSRLSEMPSYVLISTNILESSITLPDLEVVIDSCLECRQIMNTFQTHYASKASLDQRKGRVGRTKPGFVYRLLSVEQYMTDVPEISEVSHDMSLYVIQLLNAGMDPFRFLDAEQGHDSVYETRERLHALDIRFHKSAITCFIETCGLTIENSVMMHAVFQQSVSSRTKWLVAFLVCIVHFYQHRMVHWFYFPPDKTQTFVLRRAQRAFCFEDDLLLSVAKMLLFVFQDTKRWKDRATEYSMNHKTLKDFRSLVLHTLKPLIPEFSFASLAAVFYPSEDSGDEEDHDAELIQEVRHFFVRYPYSLYDPTIVHRYRNTGYLDSSACFSCVDVFLQLNKTHHVIPLCYYPHDDDAITVWINVPWNEPQLRRELKEKAKEVYDLHQSQFHHQEHFRATVVDEIENEVAYRPNMAKMLATQADFSHLVARMCV